MDNEEFRYQLVSWGDVRDRVRNINIELATIIDKISPDKHYPLITASYRFGDLIVKDGLPYLPTPSGLIPVNSAELNSKVVELLSYAKIPLILLLNKASEVFIYADERVIPLNVFYSGKCFGTFETLSSVFGFECLPIWNVSAGGRVIFTLPKITEISGFKRLRAYYNISADLNVRFLSDHWQLFKEISHQSNFNQEWQQDLIFFTGAWFKNKKDPAWSEFREYIFKQGWIQSHQFAIAKYQIGILWQQFVKAMHHRNLKPTIYLSDTVKHIFAMAIAAAPGIRPADNSQQIAPTTGIKKAILEIYQLKNYLPTIMHTDMLKEENRKFFYSLNFPTLLEGTHKGRKELTIMIDLKEIKLMLETLHRFLKPENNLLSGIHLDYFHVEEDKHGEIKQSKLLPELDQRLLMDKQVFPEREFCTTSQFWRGCVMIEKDN